MQDNTFYPLKNCEIQGDTMQQPSDIDRILTLYSLGWGAKKIAKELGISRRTAKKYIKSGNWKPFHGKGKSRLEGLELWLKERFERHRGNADVVRQELREEKGICVSLRTVQRAVQAWRREAEAAVRATVRFETDPGKQLQIDFGSTKVSIGGESIRVYLFVATLGYSRRIYVAPSLHDKQTVWFRGLEGAFHHFGGTTQEVLLDNAKSLVDSHHPQSREVVFNSRFKAFAQYWGFCPKACAPYRARTK